MEVVVKAGARLSPFPALAEPDIRVLQYQIAHDSGTQGEIVHQCVYRGRGQAGSALCVIVQLLGRKVQLFCVFSCLFLSPFDEIKECACMMKLS